MAPPEPDAVIDGSPIAYLTFGKILINWEKFKYHLYECAGPAQEALSGYGREGYSGNQNLVSESDALLMYLKGVDGVGKNRQDGECELMGMPIVEGLHTIRAGQDDNDTVPITATTTTITTDINELYPDIIRFFYLLREFTQALASNHEFSRVANSYLHGLHTIFSILCKSSKTPSDSGYPSGVLYNGNLDSNNLTSGITEAIIRISLFRDSTQQLQQWYRLVQKERMSLLVKMKGCDRSNGSDRHRVLFDEVVRSMGNAVDEMRTCQTVYLELLRDARLKLLGCLDWVLREQMVSFVLPEEEHQDEYAVWLGRAVTATADDDASVWGWDDRLSDPATVVTEDK